MSKNKIFILVGVVALLIIGVAVVFILNRNCKNSVMQELNSRASTDQIYLVPQEVEASIFSDTITLKNVRLVSGNKELLIIGSLDVKGWNEQALKNSEKAQLFDSLILENLRHPDKKDAGNIEHVILQGVQGRFNNFLPAIKTGSESKQFFKKFLADMEETLSIGSVDLKKVVMPEKFNLDSLSMQKFVWPKTKTKVRVAELLSVAGLNVTPEDEPEKAKIKSLSLHELEFLGGDLKELFSDGEALPILSNIAFKALKIEGADCSPNGDKKINWEKLSMEDFDGAKLVNIGKFFVSNLALKESSGDVSIESIKWDHISLNPEKIEDFSLSSEDFLENRNVILSGLELKNFFADRSGEKYKFSNLKVDILAEKSKLDIALQGFEITPLLASLPVTQFLGIGKMFDKSKRDLALLNFSISAAGGELQQDSDPENKFQKWNYQIKTDLAPLFSIDLNGKLKTLFVPDDEVQVSFSNAKLTLIDKKIFNMVATFTGKKESELRKDFEEKVAGDIREDGTDRYKANMIAVRDYIANGGKLVVDFALKGDKDKDGDSWVLQEDIGDLNFADIDGSSKDDDERENVTITVSREK